MSDHGDGTQLSHGGPSVEVGILGGRFLGSERPDPWSKVIVQLLWCRLGLEPAGRSAPWWSSRCFPGIKRPLPSRLRQ